MSGMYENRQDIYWTNDDGTSVQVTAGGGLQDWAAGTGTFLGVERDVPVRALDPKPLNLWQRLKFRLGAWLEGVGLGLQS